MDVSAMDTDSEKFDAITYVRILVAIAKADPDNGPPEFAFVRRRAKRLGVDYDEILNSTDKSFSIEKQNLTRVTALMILRDTILLASLDRNISLPERQRIYTYAEKFDIARKDVDALEALLQEYRELNTRWKQLLAPH